MILLRPQRRFLIMLAVAVLLHALLLLIPAARDSLMTPVADNALHVRLRQAPPVIEDAAREPKSTTSVPGDRRLPVRRVELVQLPAPPAAATAPESESETPDSPASPARILSWQFDYPDPLSRLGPVEDIAEDWLEYFARSHPSLDDVLNEPSLQLPFVDDRIYLVDSYDPGLAGSTRRFFDNVTVPFGWTTRYNTRVQCAWILIIAGCSWGHNSLFHEKAKKREDTLPD